MATTPPKKVKQRGFSTVEEYRIFEETVERETKCIRDESVFQKRPIKCFAIADKVTQIKPGSHACIDAQSKHREIIEQAERSLLCSTDKIEYPETSSQEIGWIVKRQADKNVRWREDGTSELSARCLSKKEWYCPLIRSDIVESFENYVAVRHANLFAKSS